MKVWIQLYGQTVCGTVELYLFIYWKVLILDYTHSVMSHNLFNIFHLNAVFMIRNWEDFFDTEARHHRKYIVIWLTTSEKQI